MSGGSTTTTSNANGHVAFNPTSIGGGNISVGGSVGQGEVHQGSQSSATGPSVGLDLKMSPPVPGALQLINLRGLNLDQQIEFINLAQTAKSEYVPMGPSAGEGW
mgnify:CR=1 FL=1|jgi:hypothetical protein